ncbi:class II aldolase/adducin family protein [Methylomarinum vadi]|uniref:class II aldolase/adducin family protein n=1 Tax=Methylomarinum vadi TaxID=438855 RepID=UPI0004DF8416|nr:class II aldolase/adducin family protein [Methylomarinum vadi]
MTGTEGVIKYQLHHRDVAIDRNVSTANLSAWRLILFRLNLIGQNAARYGGYGYGNISERLGNDQFIISGTQTGHLALLEPQHFAVVDRAEPGSNRLYSHGHCNPSSEALTHAILYQQNNAIGAVIHVHCPEIWCRTKTLELPFTPENIPYGTVDMVVAVTNLFTQNAFDQCGIFSMLGHEDGIVAFGSNITEAATLLIDKLSQAITVELNQTNR